MTKPDWVTRIVTKEVQTMHELYPGAVKRMLLSEYARTLQIVGRLEKAVRLDQHTYTAGEKELVLAVFEQVRAAITKGRK